MLLRGVNDRIHMLEILFWAIWRSGFSGLRHDRYFPGRDILIDCVQSNGTYVLTIIYLDTSIPVLPERC
jgi:hypothetical protein